MDGFGFQSGLDISNLELYLDWMLGFFFSLDFNLHLHFDLLLDSNPLPPLLPGASHGWSSSSNTSSTCTLEEPGGELCMIYFQYKLVGLLQLSHDCPRRHVYIVQ